jgi:2-polyprenyl-3-methyl-5-hydroxy-6-metoxy-1,4-benzoquinol methylase
MVRGRQAPGERLRRAHIQASRLVAGDDRRTLWRNSVITIRERWWLSTRIDDEEWLDHGHGTLAEIDQSLADLGRINRWLGGMWGLGRYLYPRIRACQSTPVRLLDLGAGGCTLPATIARWARQERISLHVIGLDLQHTHLQWGRKQLLEWPEITYVQGDVAAPPFAGSSVDFVISSLFLHHFTADTLVQRLPIWASLARRSLIMTDLLRYPLPYWFLRTTSPIFARSRITRHDAAVSLRRAYRPQELQGIVAAAGFDQARVYTHFPYRMVVVIDHQEPGTT